MHIATLDNLTFLSPHAQFIAKILTWNVDIAHSHADDITLEESLLVPPDGGNCLNWTLGHIVKYRGMMVERAGFEIPWPTDKYDRFKRTSAALTDPSEAASVTEMLADLDRSQEILLAWCTTADDAELATPNDSSQKTLGGLVGRLAWHECYHLGQFEIFRNMAGKHEPVFT